MWNQAHPFLKQLIPYEPGKPIEDVARELGLDPASIIKLASNENPLGPSPKAVEAYKDAVKELHLYPDGGAFYLRKAIADTLKLNREQVVVGAGSNELIELIGHAFLDSNSSVVASKHAFIVYKLIAQLFNAPFIEVPDVHYGHDLDAMAKAIRKDTKVVFIANPNNPTGTRIPNDEVKAFIKKVSQNVAVVIDEAYYEYLGLPPDSVSWLAEYPNLILLRTFSKIHGLASLRLGYGLMNPEMADVLQRCRQPFNTTLSAQRAGLAAWSDHDHQNKTRAMNAKGIVALQDFCKEIGVEYVPSSANFLMIKVKNPDQIFQDLLKKGIIIRPLRGYDLADWVRVSIGTPQQIERFQEEFKRLKIA